MGDLDQEKAPGQDAAVRADDGHSAAGTATSGKQRADGQAADAATRRMITPSGADGNGGAAGAQAHPSKWQEFKDSAKLAGELAKLILVNPLNGNFEGNLDAGLALYYFKQIAPNNQYGKLLELQGRSSQVVHIKGNLYHQQVELTAQSLQVAGFSAETFTSKGVTLKGVDLKHAGGTDTLDFAAASINQVVFIRGSEHVLAASVELTKVGAVKSDGAKGALVTSLRFDEAKVTGIVYPGMPPVDLDFKQAGLSFSALWASVSAKNGQQPAAGGALPTAPKGLMPDGSRIQIELKGLRGKGGMVDGNLGGSGGFEHLRVALVKSGHDLASVSIDGFQSDANSDGGAASGTIETLQVMGDPALVQALVENEQIKSQPAVRQALDLLKQIGMKPAVGGTLTVHKLALSSSGTSGKVSAGDINANLVLPGIGKLDLSLSGVTATPGAAKSGARFNGLVATLADPQGKELAHLELGGASGSTDAKMANAKGAIQKIAARGNLAELARAFESATNKLPPPVPAVLDTVRALGLSGTIDGSLQSTVKNGATEVTGDFHARLDAPGIGEIDLTLNGFRGKDETTNTTAAIQHFAARLIGKNGRDAATLKVDGSKVSGSTFHAKSIQVTGDAKSLGGLLDTLQKKAPSLPPEVRSALALAKAQDLVGANSATFENVSMVSDKKGGETARGDFHADFKLEGIGSLRVKIAGLNESFRASGEVGASFDRMEMHLIEPNGTEAASFLAIGGKGANPAKGDDPKSASFDAKHIETKGDAKRVSQMLAAAKTKITALPKQAQDAFASLGNLGADGRADVAIDNFHGVQDKSGTQVSGDVSSSFELPGAGRADVKLRGARGQFDNGGQQMLFDAFEATLFGPGGQRAAHFLVEGSGADKAGGKLGGTGDTGFHAGRVQLDGSSKDLSALIAGIEQRLQTLPPAVTRAFDLVKQYGSTVDAKGQVTATDVDVGQKDGAIQVKGDLSARVEAPGVGLLEARLKRGQTTGGAAGFEALDVKLFDAAGGVAAALHVAGVKVGTDGKTASVGSIEVQGDGAKLHALLDPKVQALLPAEIAQSLGMLDQARLQGALSGISIRQDASGGFTAEANVLRLSGAIDLTDKQGNRYVCPEAQLVVSGARVKMSADRKPQEIDAASLEAHGQFSSVGGARSMHGTATLRTGAVQVVMGPDGAPLKVSANDIQASGQVDTGPGTGAVEPKPAGQPQTREQKLAGFDHTAQVAEDAAGMIQTADVHTHTPLFPGQYGKHIKIGVPAGATLDVNLQVRQNALTGETNVRFAPTLDLPAWLRLRGIDLETKGREGALKVNLQGFFDINITKYVVGKKTMSLNLAELAGELMANMRKSIEDAKPPEEDAGAQKNADKDSAWLEGQHEKWRKKTAQHEQDGLHDSPSKQRKTHDKDAEAEPRSASLTDFASPKGMDLVGTYGTADVDLAPRDHATQVGGGSIPAGSAMHLHGKSSGGGQLQLTADQMVAELGNSTVAAQGLDTGAVNVKPSGAAGMHVDFSGFSLKSIRWDSLPKK